MSKVTNFFKRCLFLDIFLLCMLGSNLELLRLWHWQPDALTTRLYLIHTRLDLIHRWKLTDSNNNPDSHKAVSAVSSYYRPTVSLVSAQNHLSQSSTEMFPFLNGVTTFLSPSPRSTILFPGVNRPLTGLNQLSRASSSCYSSTGPTIVLLKNAITSVGIRIWTSD